MILRSDVVAELLDEGHTDSEDPLVIVPEPTDLRSFGSAAVDLRLGTWFLTLRQGRMPYMDPGGWQHDKTYDTTDSNYANPQERSETEPEIGLASFPETNPSMAQLTKYHYVAFGESYYLHPGSFALGVTLEWIRLRADLAGYVIGKSSWGRRGLIIATATGVHPGFKGCLTLELTNVGEIPIAIKPGMKICQLFLHRVETRPEEYKNESQFLGLRKPILGRVKMDDIAQKLARAYHPRQFTSGQ